MREVMFADGPRAGQIEQVSDEACGVRDESTGTWYRPAGRTVRVEVWEDDGPLGV